MSQDIWTSIEVGGSLPEQLRDDFETAFENDFSEGDNPSDEIDEALQQGKKLSVSGFVNYGDPDEVTEFCREHDLPYSYTCEDGGGEWNACGTYWAPGMEKEANFDCADDGQPVLYVSEIRERLANGTLAEHLDKVENYAGKAIPPLTLAQEKQTLPIPFSAGAAI